MLIVAVVPSIDALHPKTRTAQQRSLPIIVSIRSSSNCHLDLDDAQGILSKGAMSGAKDPPRVCEPSGEKWIPSASHNRQRSSSGATLPCGYEKIPHTSTMSSGEQLSPPRAQSASAVFTADQTSCSVEAGSTLSLLGGMDRATVGTPASLHAPCSACTLRRTK